MLLADLLELVGAIDLIESRLLVDQLVLEPGEVARGDAVVIEYRPAPGDPLQPV